MQELTKRQRMILSKLQKVQEEKTHLREKQACQTLDRAKEMAQKRAQVRGSRAGSSKVLLSRFLNKDLVLKTKHLEKTPPPPVGSSIKKEKPGRGHHSTKAMTETKEMDDTESITASEYFDLYQGHRRPPRTKQPNLWAAIYSQEHAHQTQAKIDAKATQHLNAAKHRTILNSQMREKQQAQARERDRDAAFARAQEAQLEVRRVAAEAEERAKAEKHAAEARDFHQILASKQQERAIARTMKIKFETQEVLRVKSRMREEAERLEAQKLNLARRQAEMKRENAQVLERKARAREKLRQEELRLNREYVARLEKQEQERTQALENTYALQEMRVNVALLNVKSDAEIAAEDALRAAQVQQQAAKEMQEKDEKKEHLRKERIQTQLRGLAEQKQEQQLRREAQKREDAVQARIWQHDYEQAQVQEESKTRSRRCRNLDHRALLERQIEQDQTRRVEKDKYGMSALEMQLNQQLIEKAGLDIPRGIL